MPVVLDLFTQVLRYASEIEFTCFSKNIVLITLDNPENRDFINTMRTTNWVEAEIAKPQEVLTPLKKSFFVFIFTYIC